MGKMEAPGRLRGLRTESVCVGSDLTQESRELVQSRIAGNPAQSGSQRNVCVGRLGRASCLQPIPTQSGPGKAEYIWESQGGIGASRVWEGCRHHHPSSDGNRYQCGDMVAWRQKARLYLTSLVCAWTLPKPIATQLHLKEPEETDLTPG